MQDNVIFIIGCFILAGFFCEIAWSVYLYTMRKVEYFFYHRYLDKISKDTLTKCSKRVQSNKW